MTRLPMAYLPPNHYGNYIDPLTAAYLQQDQMARTENEERYLDIINGLQGARERITGDLESFGGSLRDDTNRRADVSLDNQISDLTSRGLGASTIRSTIKRANDRERNAELRRVEDLITDKKTSADERLTNALYGAIERRNDVQPNPQTLAQLNQGLGQSGAGFGGGYAAGYAGGYGGYAGPARPGYATAPPMPGYTGLSGKGNFFLPGMLTQVGPGAAGATPPSAASWLRGSTTPYSAPVANGRYEDPAVNAAARYAERQNAPVPGGYYGGGYGYGMSPYANTYYGGPRGGGLSYMKSAVTNTAAPVAQSTSKPNAFLNAQNALIDQRNAAKAEFMRPKTHVWSHDRTYYPGFGSTLKKELDGVGLAPGVANLPYGNPVQQLNQLQAGAVNSMPNYQTMPTGYPLGQPSVKPTVPTQQRNAMLRAASAFNMPGFLNPYAMLIK